MLDIQTAVIENDLSEITKHIEEAFKNKLEGKTQETGLMTPEEQAEALKFLKSQNLIQSILEDITTLGYVGEDENKLLLFLCAVSRKLNKPISVLIRSQSSTGKSYLIDIICALLPLEDVHKWTSLTPKALYYMAPDALKHKFIAIDERAGMEEAEYPIRSLQSGGVLSLAVPIKNPTSGQIMTEQIIKEGPIAYVDGSTDTRVNPENANRCFEIFLDETAEQTKRVQTQQKKSHSLEGLNAVKNKETIKRIHQNAQRLLKPVKVIIPYIDLIDFPSDWIRTRRDHDRFLSLIVCIAFLHQYQREIKYFNAEKIPLNPPLIKGDTGGFNKTGISYIESNIKDYAIAYKLAKTVLFNTFAELEKPVSDFYFALCKMTEEKAKEQGISSLELEFTRRDVRAFTKMPDYLVKRYMRILTDLEYFEVKTGTQGTRFVYRLIKESEVKKEFAGLTTPDELRHRFKARNERKNAQTANQ
ncbi:MAG: DnaG primase-like protein [uncultured bacterium]|nr:MAG: DnaG primase-like protein [uncultured bacterium]